MAFQRNLAGTFFQGSANKNNMNEKLAKRIPQNSYLLTLPIDILFYLTVYLPSAIDKLNLIKTCSKFYQILQTNFAVGNLLQFIADNNKDLVKKILDRYPDLLLLTPSKELEVEIKTTWQRFYAKKPLEFALKLGRLQIVKVMLPYFEQLPNSRDEALAQWKPHEISEKEKASYANDLKDLIAAITQEKFLLGSEKDRLIDTISEETALALKKFRQKLLPDKILTLNDYINTEQLLIASYQAYKNFYEQFCNWKQQALYCQCVCGFIQGLLSAEIAEILCQGLVPVIDEKEPIGLDATMLRLRDNFSFYRNARGSQHGIGFDFLVGAYGFSKVLENKLGKEYISGILERFEQVCELRQQVLDDLKKKLEVENFPQPALKKC